MYTSQIEAKTISNKKITKGYYLLKLEVPYGFQDAQPGQFIHIRIDDSCDPLLRRPFSIHSLAPIKTKTNKQKFHLDVLYEIKGKGTDLLSEKRVGEYLDILGPLGTGFNFQPQDTRGHTSIIISGGAGVAPLFFLVNKILRLNPERIVLPIHIKEGTNPNQGKRYPNKNKVVVLIGAATSAKILKEKEFHDLGCEVNVSTEDGTRGHKGKIVALFEKILSKKDITFQRDSRPNSISVYACGPQAMLTTLAKICMIKKVPLQVSLEEFMGCGIGACLGCAIETKDGYKRVCHDGPVFWAKDIAWKF